MRFNIEDKACCSDCNGIQDFVTPRKIYRVLKLEKRQGLDYIMIVDDCGNDHFLRENRFYKSFS